MKKHQTNRGKLGEMGERERAEEFQISGSLIARNTLINLIGQGLPLLVAVGTIPFIVKGMGTERFGLLSIAWVFLGSFAIFDLGLSRATTKFVAEAFGKGDHQVVPSLVWTAVTVQAIFGIIGGLILFGLTPFLVENVLNIPAELIGEAKTTFYLLALYIPLSLIYGSFSGVLEAAQRFDLVNLARIPSSISTYLLPMFGLFIGFSLPGIVALILLAKSSCLALIIALNFRLIPDLKKYSASFDFFPRLFSFGAWIMMSNLISPILYYLDRFIIGSILTMTAVAYYSAPFEMTARMGIISTSLLMTVLPAVSALGIAREDDLQQLFVRSMKYLLLINGPIVLILMIFADNILRFWLGADFAQHGTLAFRILLLGALISLPTFMSLGLIQGLGRPDIAAKIYLLYVPLNIGLVWFLIHTMGITGAALSFALRALYETVLFYIISSRLIHLPCSCLKENGFLRIFYAFLALSIWLLLSLAIINAFIMRICFAFIGIGIFFMIIWCYALDEIDKGAIVSSMGKLLSLKRAVGR